MKIGITSQNFRTVTPHAGKARRFLVYEASSADDIAQVERLDLSKDMAMCDWHDRTDAHPLDALDVLVVGSCGECFLKNMAQRGVRVVVASQEDPVIAIQSMFQQAA